MKKITGLMLILAMLASASAMTACGGEEAPKAEPTVAATEAPAPIETEAEAVADGKVTVTASADAVVGTKADIVVFATRQTGESVYRIINVTVTAAS